MATLTDEEKFENEVDERKEAWNKLRTIPEYIQDYNDIKNEKFKEGSPELERIKNTWGFWPLEDPESKNGNFDFICNFSSYIPDVDRFQSGINWNGFEYFSSKDGYLIDPNGYRGEKIDKVSPFINAEIDLRIPLHVLRKEFEDRIREFKSILDLQKQNTKKHDHIDYLILCLKKLKLDNKEIINRLLPIKYQSLKYDNQHKKDEIQKIRNRLNKLGK